MTLARKVALCMVLDEEQGRTEASQLRMVARVKAVPRTAHPANS